MRATRAAGARNICVGFPDVTRASGVNLAPVTQNSRTMCVIDLVRRAPATQQGMLLLDPSVYIYIKFNDTVLFKKELPQTSRSR
jgi:hypothetical protein